MQPLFSIVIANYNFGRFLGEAIESVVNQGLGGEVEIIICDAASTDESVDVIRKYANGLPPKTELFKWLSRQDRIADCDYPISWWCSEKDGGQSAAFNKGFSHAKGRFLVWLNADDVLTPGALISIKEECTRHPDCEWFIGSSLWADESLNVSRCFCAHRFSILRAKWGFLSVGGPSSFFTKRLLTEAGGIDENLHYVMDTDLWYKFFYKLGARYRRTRRNIFAYRQHEASKMSGADKHTTERALENRRNAQRESSILRERYGRRSGLRFYVAEILSFSLLDKIVAISRTLRWRGRHATAI